MNDDPRKLRSLVERASSLANSHEVGSVMVGLVAPRGDLRFPDFVDFLQSALRVEDGVFRMTRERTVLHLADVDETTARATIDRLLARFHDEFPNATDAEFDSYYVAIAPRSGETTVKDVLPQLFGAPPVGDDSVH